MDGFALAASKKVTTPTIMQLSLSLSTFFFFSPCRVMLFVCDVQQKRDLQSTKNWCEKEWQDDNTDWGYLSLTLSSMKIPKRCCHPPMSVWRYSDGCRHHFCAALIVIVLAASWRRHGR
jgi:hypothetical protein